MGPTLAIVSAVSAVAGAVGGMQKMRAANQEAMFQEQQAGIAAQEAQKSALQKAQEVEAFAQEQTMRYAKSGVTLAGSPALVIAATRRKGAEEVTALERQGAMQKSLLENRAWQTRASGRSALLGSLAGSATSVMSNYALGKKIGLYGGTPATSAASVPVSPLQLPGSSGYA